MDIRNQKSEVRNSPWRGETESAEQTSALGRALGAICRAGEVVALVGELGVGKTQWVRGMAEGLGVDPTAVASPTFVMVHEYIASRARELGAGNSAEPSPPFAGTIAGTPTLIHIDAYRFKSLEDLESIGWETSGHGGAFGGEMRAHAVVVVEWADRLAELLGDDVLTVALTHAGQTRRGVCVTAAGAWADRFAEVCAALQRVHRAIHTGTT